MVQIKEPTISQLEDLKDKILQKKAIIGIIGMGNIGLSLLEAFSKSRFHLRGYDIDKKKVERIKRKENLLNFYDLSHLYTQLDQHHFKPSDHHSVLKDADVIIISVSTSLDKHHTPDLSNLRSAFDAVAKNLKKGQLIILQSTTYPGTTEEELLPILEQSGLHVGTDFYLSYVPEIADPGNDRFIFTSVPRIISGVTHDCQEVAILLYQQLGCETHPCHSIKVAESAKLLQNAFRLINISFINEMKVMFDKMKIDVWDVIEAASTKPFGFMPFYPGPGIGGDCIPITPFYLSWKAEETGGPSTMIERAWHVDESMPFYVINKIIFGLNNHKKAIRGAKILLLGVSYKKNVNDLRESPALKILEELKKMKAAVFYHDPYIQEIKGAVEFKSILFSYEELKIYDAVVILTDHDFYDWKKMVANSQLVIDTRNVTSKIDHGKSKIIKS